MTKTTGSAAAMPRWGGRFSAHASSDEKLRYARTCYDHIAGLLSVGLAERLAKREFVILGDEAGEVTPAGADFLSKLGVDLSRARAKRRVFCRPCVDWTERRPHIGGAVGAALANRCFELKWIELAAAGSAQDGIVKLAPARSGTLTRSGRNARRRIASGGSAPNPRSVPSTSTCSRCSPPWSSRQRINVYRAIVGSGVTD